ncbi:unnamed protein product [[Candida] boidinii]|uniref:Unnamed protein product n=1 Tax=Candida boidinii TaxID=5477 RepID=A0ACB5U2G0_CANBO|nr:unnamed protein product [[Candida] boidinii]
MSLVELVELNLTYHLLWSEIDTVSIEFKIKNNDDNNNNNLHKFDLIHGYPPKQLNPTIPYKHQEGEIITDKTSRNLDSKISKEWVLPILKSTKLTIEKIDLIFENIKLKNGLIERPKRILLGIIDDDSSIVYYTIHDGVTKPRQS